MSIKQGFNLGISVHRVNQFWQLPFLFWEPRVGPKCRKKHISTSLQVLHFAK